MSNTVQDWLREKELAEARFREHQAFLAERGRPLPPPTPKPVGPEEAEFDRKVVWPPMIFLLAVFVFCLGVLVGRYIHG